MDHHHPKINAWAIAVLLLLCRAAFAHGAVDCGAVTALVSNCSNFITYGVPDPTLGSPCCDAVVSLNSLADTTDNRRSVCRCLVSLMSTYNPNVSAIGRLPVYGFYHSV
ncbi:hypothetical protein QJS10_CPA03g02036 [Acorus calamus]|uniref:Bifunctional inhibitor/plant lipid transfer protein/seed storage helical domain-containing protein n=1 Tax=Acorus calamus TaxID=4465 RepID=A0AAV9F9I0_ACOCL|nr:hypothetical protein QJS10_CPA03g02036 [Acorus calamus]